MTGPHLHQNHRLRGLAALAAAAALASSTPTAWAAPSTELRVVGDVSHPTVFDRAALQALPPVTQTDTFQAGTAGQTHVYTGPLLWNVVSSAGIRTDAAVKNDVLSKYVLATGSDGYRVAYAAGELSPSFGNRPDLVAVTETVAGVDTPLGADGFARATAPGDAKGGRYVSNLASLAVGGSGPYAAGSGGPSSRFTVAGDVLHPMTFDLAALEALPAVERTVRGVTYRGASFWDLLNATVGLATDAAVKNDLLDLVVVATGSDGYRALFSLGELAPAFGNQPDIIAYATDGVPLASDGFARIVVPGDGKAGRFVSNLISLDVFHATAAAVPEPSSAALLGAGLVAAVAWTAVRRPRPGSRSTP